MRTTAATSATAATGPRTSAPRPSTAELTRLTRQARSRLASVDLLREEHRIITLQSERRLVESRALLLSSRRRWTLALR